MRSAKSRDSYERFALWLWDYIKSSARLFFPWTAPIVVLWTMALGATYWPKIVTIPTAIWLTVCLHGRMRRD